MSMMALGGAIGNELSAIGYQLSTSTLGLAGVLVDS
jgi:hypothetical protein